MSQSEIFTGEKWSIQRFVSGFSNNAFLITCARTGRSVIIDTPADPHELVEAAGSTQVEAILITHGHHDHVEGLSVVSKTFEVPVGIGGADRNSLPDSANSAELIDVSNGNQITVGDITLTIIETPGHTPGSTCFLLDPPSTGEHGHLFTGDTLFPGGPGRSSSHAALKQILESLEQNLLTLPDSTVVLPGHGEFTTIGESKREYAVFSSRPLDPDLAGDVTWM